MTQTQPDPFAGRVVVGTDGSDHSHEALRWAAEYARQVGAEVVVVHGWEMPVASVRSMSHDVQVVDEAHSTAQEIVDTAAGWVREAVPGCEVRTALVPGGPTKALIDASESARCVVVGSRGRGALAHVLLGSTSDSVAARAHCPVVIVAPGTRWQEGAKVLLATDGSAGAQDATRYAFIEAARLGVGLEVVTAVEMPPMVVADAFVVPPAPEELRDEIADAVARELESFRTEQPGVPVELVVETGGVEQLVEERSAGASFVVTGSRGRGAALGLLTGSASRQVVAGARCPIVVVR